DEAGEVVDVEDGGGGGVVAVGVAGGAAEVGEPDLMKIGRVAAAPDDGAAVVGEPDDFREVPAGEGEAEVRFENGLQAAHSCAAGCRGVRGEGGRGGVAVGVAVPKHDGAIGGDACGEAVRCSWRVAEADDVSLGVAAEGLDESVVRSAPPDKVATGGRHAAD